MLKLYSLIKSIGIDFPSLYKSIPIDLQCQAFEIIFSVIIEIQNFSKKRRNTVSD